MPTYRAAASRRRIRDRKYQQRILGTIGSGALEGRKRRWQALYQSRAGGVSTVI